MSNKYSIHKIAWFPEKLQSFRDGKVTAPIYVRVKPTNRCNHHCAWCVYKSSFSRMHALAPDREEDWSGPIAQLTGAKLWELLVDFQEIGVKALTFSGGGEPLLYPGIVKAMQHTLDLGIDLSVITNGQLLFGERAYILRQAKWVRVSVDYSSEAEIQDFRGVDKRFFKELLKNLLDFSIAKSSTCDLFVNFIVHKQNFETILMAAKLYKEHGVENIRFSPMWTPKFQEYHASIRDDVQRQLNTAQELADTHFSVSSTYSLDGSAHSLVRGYCKCFFCQVVPIVAADGNVYACHNKAYDQKGMIGSILDKKFSELWFSPEAEAFFSRLNPVVDCQHQCAEDSKNLLIHDILSAHDNFV